MKSIHLFLFVASLLALLFNPLTPLALAMAPVEASSASTAILAPDAVAPVAYDDSYTTDEDQTLVVDSAIGVLANDIDDDGDPLTARVYGTPDHGEVTMNTDGSFTYIPDADYYGTDSFSYRANDGELNSNFATVTITILSVNDAPVAVDDAYQTDEDAGLTVGTSAGILQNDSDIDSSTMRAVLDTPPLHGEISLTIAGSFNYTPHTDFHGIDSFTYHAFDGSLNSNTATVTITVISVNDAPVATDDAYSVNQDESLMVDEIAGILMNDADVDGDAISASLVSGPLHGSLSLDASGAFTYTPVPGYSGADSFTYQATDGLLNSNTAAVTITIVEGNHKLFLAVLVR